MVSQIQLEIQQTENQIASVKSQISSIQQQIDNQNAKGPLKNNFDAQQARRRIIQNLNRSLGPTRERLAPLEERLADLKVQAMNEAEQQVKPEFSENLDSQTAQAQLSTLQKVAAVAIVGGLALG